MGKKDKKLSPDEVRAKALKKLVNQFKRLVTLGIIGTLVYAVYNPSVIPFPTAQERVSTIKQHALASSPQAVEAATTVLGIATEKISTLSRNTIIPKGTAGLPEEIVVEDVIDNFSEEIKNLPENQVKRIKTHICQDVIDEATRSAR